MVKMDRYEFMKTVIGEGSTEMLKEVFNNDNEFDNFVADESEKFEDILAKNMSKMTIRQLNYLSKKYNLDILVFELNKTAKLFKDLINKLDEVPVSENDEVLVIDSVATITPSKPKDIEVREIFIEELGKTATLTIHKKAQDAINVNWESLYFADNLDTFASIEVNGYIAVLLTHGDVRILNEAETEEYSNGDISEIKKILNEDRMEDYFIDNNNWFAVDFGKVIPKDNEENIEYEHFDDVVFEACPNSLTELETSFVEYVVSMYKNIVEN